MSKKIAYVDPFKRELKEFLKQINYTEGVYRYESRTNGGIYNIKVEKVKDLLYRLRIFTVSDDMFFKKYFIKKE